MSSEYPTRARISARNPQAQAICDRCGFKYTHSDLRWQFDWRGSALQNTRILVCWTCQDTAQQQLRAIVVPSDPTPVMNPRTEAFDEASDDYFTASAPTVYDAMTGIPVPSADNIVTQDGSYLTTQPVGIPTGYSIDAVMPLQNAVRYGVALNVLSASSTGSPVVTVTCYQPHGLSTGSQVAVEGMAFANGLYSVTVTSATAFTYQANSTVPSGSILSQNARVVTANVGLPYNYAQVPETGA